MSEKIKTAVMEVIKAHMDGEDKNTKAVLSDVMKSVRETLEQEPCEDCRNCKKWDDCECGRKGHINGTSIGYSIGECKDYEPCADAVSREAILEGIEELKKSPWATANRSHGYEYLITEALDVVKDLCIKQEPSVTQKSGKWIYRRGDKYSCSKCGTTTSVDEGGLDEKPMYKFCPYCGAKMESEE